MILFDRPYALLECIGRGFFVLLLYFGAIVLVWGRPEPFDMLGIDAVDRNEPCPCGCDSSQSA
ncbi:hypothetical protein [Candidatus Methylomirabilis sp.]|uniref:hypothetical protein n=1 Tax=Candidatus Methylomirabilis sp. TaxID=2032687 RepID=UPI0030766823